MLERALKEPSPSAVMEAWKRSVPIAVVGLALANTKNVLSPWRRALAAKEKEVTASLRKAARAASLRKAARAASLRRGRGKVSRRSLKRPHIVKLSQNSLPRQRSQKEARERVAKETRTHLPSRERVPIPATPTVLNHNPLVKAKAKVGLVRLVGKVAPAKPQARLVGTQKTKTANVQAVETARHGTKVISPYDS